jgi:hypothetical protein
MIIFSELIYHYHDHIPSFTLEQSINKIHCYNFSSPIWHYNGFNKPEEGKFSHLFNWHTPQLFTHVRTSFFKFDQKNNFFILWQVPKMPEWPPVMQYLNHFIPPPFIGTHIDPCPFSDNTTMQGLILSVLEYDTLSPSIFLVTLS